MGHFQSECDQNKQESCKICSKAHNGECYFKNGPLPPCANCKQTTHPSGKCRFARDKNNGNNNAKTVFFAEGLMTTKQEEMEFIVDSGCTGHMASDKKILTDVKPIEEFHINVAKKRAQLTANCGGLLKINM